MGHDFIGVGSRSTLINFLTMKTKIFAVLAISLAALFAACGSEDGPGSSSSGSTGNLGTSNGSFPGTSGAPDPAFGDVDLQTLRIEPANLVATLTAGQAFTQNYKLLGKLKTQTTGDEIDLTSRAVFYVPDNYLMGGFPLNGAPNFTSRVPAAATDPPQRGGVATIQATVANSDGPHNATTTLTLKLNAGPILRPGVPADAATKFGGTVDAAKAPKLYYPNDGVMLPPNLRRLDVQWRAQGGTNLYEIAFKSAVGEVTYYSRCDRTDAGVALWVADACAFMLDEVGYNALAYTNAGQGPVTLKVRGVIEANPATLGESAEFKIEFAQEAVYGGLYYWRTTAPEGILRFDFGSPSGNAEEYMIRGVETQQLEGDQTCPGCHALSRQGTKLVASMGGQHRGRLIYINDLAKPKTDPNWLTVAPMSNPAGENRIQFASFNPDGSQFVAIYGDDANGYSGAAAGLNNPKPADLDKNKLWFHDGTTGLRTTSHQLPYRPDHPDWSPDGNTIAFSHINGGGTSQMPSNLNIEIVKKNGAGWTAPLIVAPTVAGKSRFNPNFVPDSTFLLFSEATCPGGDVNSGDCNADSDPSATTYAAKPEANAALIHLANSAKRGVIDIEENLASTGDTFPRSSPFQTKHRGNKLFWFTVASRRKAGLRIQANPQKLWMFAIDWAKLQAGQDGSFVGFYLPFQNMQTSNHIGQWTEKIVGGSQPPPPAPPPPPPPPVPPGPK
jgi:hypothetical protein